MPTAIDTKPNEVPTIPDDWKDLGVTWGYEPVSANDVRLYIVSYGGQGKTTFASSIPGSLLLDFEKHGADAIPGARAVRVRVQNYEHYRQVLDKLVQDGAQKQRRWKRIIFDTVDAWADLITRHFLAQRQIEHLSDLGHGKGWDLMKALVRADLGAVEDAGYTWACCGHLIDKEVTRPGSDKTITIASPLLTGKLHAHIVNQTEVFGMVVVQTITDRTTKQVVVGGKTHEVAGAAETRTVYRLNCTSVAAGQGKLRGVPTFNAVLELPLRGGWDIFAAEYTKAVEQAKKENKHE